MIVGLVGVCLYELPYVMLGPDAHVRFHDDLEPIVGLHSALHLKRDENTAGLLPFILGGLPAIAISPEPDVLSWYYSVLPPLWAYRANDFMIRIVAFVGLFILLRSLSEQTPTTDGIAFGVSLAFSYLPFWTPAGISAAGLPLVAVALGYCLQPSFRRATIAAGLTILFVYPFYSALAYVGVFLLPALAIAWACHAAKTREPRLAALLGIFILGIGYCLANWGVLCNLLSKDPIVWHRVEFAATEGVRETLREAIWLGLTSFSEAPANPFPFVWLAAFGYLVRLRAPSDHSVLTHGSANSRRCLIARWWVLPSCIAAVVAIALWYFIYLVLWRKFPAIFSRVPVNMVRVYFLYPLLFSLIFYGALVVIWQGNRLAKVMSIALICLQALSNVYQADWIQGWTRPSFSQYVSARPFDKAEQLIGKPRASTRIVCLAFYPSIAHFNGFRTADGYWYLYPLEYKHRFRQVIEKELAKSDHLQAYFDKWGSRVYVMSAELGGQFYLTKHNPIKRVANLELNMRALEGLGVEYVFSTVVIDQAERTGLRYVGSVEDEDAVIDLHIYTVGG
jgi:hypothetical protein